MLVRLASCQRKKQNGSWFLDIDTQNANDISKFSTEKAKRFMVLGYASLSTVHKQTLILSAIRSYRTPASWPCVLLRVGYPSHEEVDGRGGSLQIFFYPKGKLGAICCG